MEVHALIQPGTVRCLSAVILSSCWLMLRVLLDRRGERWQSGAMPRHFCRWLSGPGMPCSSTLRHIHTMRSSEHDSKHSSCSACCEK